MQNIPDCFYRLAAKAIIKDEKGRVLLIVEKGGHFGLPGGGIEFGESAAEALHRELNEELGITDVKSTTLVMAFPYFSESRQAWALWLLHQAEVTLPEKFVGDRSEGAIFMNIDDLLSHDPSQHRVHYVLNNLQGKN